ncbi:MAG: D-alanyl-D-alanine carboxypeptidase family protein [Clostridiaceae bacterium]
MKYIKKTSLVLMLLLIFLQLPVYADNTEPDIVGKEALVMDVETGEIIYAKDIDVKTYPASTTKLITALLLAENKNKTDILKYTESAKEQPEYSFNTNRKTMTVGETMTAQDVMDSILLYSANDIAYMAADNVSGSYIDFVTLMNKTVEDWGLTGTHFTSPNGLHDPDHYTTPYELSVIGRKAFANDWVKETMAKKESSVTTSDNRPIALSNSNKLLGVDGCIGGKTGFTDEAGRCLVAFFERDGRTLVGVVMNSEWGSDDTIVFEDMEKIINYGYSLDKSSLYEKGTILKTEKISYKPLRFLGPTKEIEVPIILKDNINYYDNPVNNAEMQEDYDLTDLSVWNLKDNETIGTITIKQRESSKIYYLTTDISTGSIIKANIPLYIISFIVFLVILIFVLFIFARIKKAKRKKRRFY